VPRKSRFVNEISNVSAKLIIAVVDIQRWRGSNGNVRYLIY